ncbi:spermatogenesis-associated protein 6 isoform X1 [Lampris incognitus]|uniref:spermatogenesis-associated protein 6 isoform X1 n=1 Tax=Lampris incognitus TaxID=2546036 RepID=UPI0024B59725|nr:spermatogenesis-associated protein 6 isoform X1 [Lampris incognitus]
MTSDKKLSFSRERQKYLKCTVYLDIQAIRTNPGVMLPRQEDVYLSVCIMGQYKKTHCLPPNFPLLFHHKMVFVKTFLDVVDPADVSDLLDSDTTSFELIQLVPPEGEILATLVENTRGFIYPGPRLTSRNGVPEREMVMKKSPSFPGICPKLEFSTTAVIEESGWRDSWPTSPPSCLSLRRLSSSPSGPSFTKISLSSSPKQNLRSPVSWQHGREDDGKCCSSKSRNEKRSSKARIAEPASLSPSCQQSLFLSLSDHHEQRERKERRQSQTVARSSNNSGYQRPTVASTARALSPYTHRRMCQLSEDASQRLSHLQLGPHCFRKETERQPPFLVSGCRNVSVMETPCSRHVSSPKTSSLYHSHLASFTADHTDPSLLGSYRPKPAKWGSVRPSLSPETPFKHEAVIRTPTKGTASAPSKPGASSCRSPLMVSKSTLRERFHSIQSSPSQWEQIHHRVQKILQTHGTNWKPRQAEEERMADPCDSQILQERETEEETSLYLDNRALCSKGTSCHTDGPHRAVFEDSLGKIYKNMYRRASSIY